MNSVESTPSTLIEELTHNSKQFMHRKTSIDALLMWSAQIAKINNILIKNTQKIAQRTKQPSQASELPAATQDIYEAVQQLDQRVKEVMRKDARQAEAKEMQEFVSKCSQIEQKKIELKNEGKYLNEEMKWQVVEREEVQVAEQIVENELAEVDQACKEVEALIQEKGEGDISVEQEEETSKCLRKEFRKFCNEIDEEKIEMEKVQLKLKTLQEEIDAIDERIEMEQLKKKEEEKQIMDISLMISEADCMILKQNIRMDEMRHEMELLKKETIPPQNEENYEHEIKALTISIGDLEELHKNVLPLGEEMKELNKKEEEEEEEHERVREELELELQETRELADQATWLRQTVYPLFKNLQLKTGVDFCTEKEFGVRSCAVLFEEMKQFSSRFPDMALIAAEDQKVEVSEEQNQQLEDFKRESKNVLEELQILNEARKVLEQKREQKREKRIGTKKMTKKMTKVKQLDEGV